ncbi:MAG: TolC family protein [Pseudomonadota bacterium]
MKRASKALVLVVSAAMLLSTITVSAATGGKTILTLEEAKKIALENDVQYELQEDYIQEALEDYNDLRDDTTYSRSNTSVGKISARIASKLALESAYDKVELEQFTKNDLKRASDYDVTTKYYSVMKARNALDDAKRNMELSRKDLEIGKIQLSLGLITQTTLSQLENAYKASQTTYNSANSDFENAMSSLSKEIGQELKTAEYDVDMTIYMPATANLSLETLKADYIKNNSSFFNISNALDLYEYKRLEV